MVAICVMYFGAEKRELGQMVCDTKEKFLESNRRNKKADNRNVKTSSISTRDCQKKVDEEQQIGEYWKNQMRNFCPRPNSAKEGQNLSVHIISSKHL